MLIKTKELQLEWDQPCSRQAVHIGQKVDREEILKSPSAFCPKLKESESRAIKMSKIKENHQGCRLEKKMKVRKEEDDAAPRELKNGLTRDHVAQSSALNTKLA